MANWFETKIKYQELQDDGKVKKVTEAFLVQADTFTEAEARTIKEREGFLQYPFTIETAKRTKITEIINDPYCVNAKWYQVKWVLITLDEAQGIEKRTIALSMVEANSLDKALIKFHDNMRNTIMDYDIIAISETPIYEVYPTTIKESDDDESAE